MNPRGSRALPSLGLIVSLSASGFAQVRMVAMPSLAVMPGAPAAAAAAGALFAAPALSPAAALNAAPALAARTAPAPAPAAAAAPAGVPAANGPTKTSEAATGGVMTAADAVSKAGEDGGAAFDGAISRPQVQAPDPVSAPRGDTVKFYGEALPARMASDQTQISSHLIRAIGAAKKTIDIAIYELAIKEVYDALKSAKDDHGVKIRVIVDQGHVYPEKDGGHISPEMASLLGEPGFEIRTLRGADRFGIMHNKFAVFDGALLETGSYNWSHAADVNNFENALFDDRAERVASYQGYWDWMWKSSRPADLAHPPEKIVLDENGKSAPLPPAPQDQALPLKFNGRDFPREAFTPHGAAKFVAAAIDASQDSVELANFSFTNTEIIEALKRAKDRLGAEKVRLIFDRQQYQHLSEMPAMADLGFQVRLSSGKGGRGVMHNKFGVFDGKFVETGSFNWTNGGEFTNYENAPFLDAPDDVAFFKAYFQRIWDQGQAPTAADRGPSGPRAP